MNTVRFFSFFLILVLGLAAILFSGSRGIWLAALVPFFILLINKFNFLS